MLINSLSVAERLELSAAAASEDDGPVRDFINGIVWARLLQKWEHVILRFWFLKTWRYKDLESVWVKLFGERPR